MKHRLYILWLVSNVLVLSSSSAHAQSRRRAPAKPFTNLQEVKTHLSKNEKQGTFSGSVLIVLKGEEMLHKAYGLASKEEQTSNRKDTKFNIGSINKLFTKIAAARLIQDGKLTLDDKVVDYVPELEMKMAEKITIRHLLTMSSGLGFYSDSPEYIRNWKNLRDIEDYLPIVKRLPLSFAPGQGRQYSNAGYELLGIVIQRVSGMSYYDYVQKHVYDKAGMKNSGSFESDVPTENLASGYTNYPKNETLGPGSQGSSTGFQINNQNRHSIKGTAGGGGYSTTADLLALVKALRKNQLLDKQHTDLIFNNFSQEDSRNPRLGVGGGSIGINAMVLADTDKDYTVVVLANYDPPTAQQMALRIEATILSGKL